MLASKDSRALMVALQDLAALAPPATYFHLQTNRVQGSSAVPALFCHYSKACANMLVHLPFMALVMYGSCQLAKLYWQSRAAMMLCGGCASYLL